MERYPRQHQSPAAENAGEDHRGPNIAHLTMELQ
jgi:hypothetical protein